VHTRILIIVLGTALATAAVAEELQENFVPVRAMGMGGAFTAVANDESAIWMNPAGVARARKARNRKRFFLSKFPNLGVGANARGRKLYQAQTGDKEKGLSDVVAESGDLGGDKPYWVNLSLFPVTMYDYDMSTPGAFGLFSNSTTKMLVEADTPDQARINMVSDAGALTNFSWTNRTNRFSVGMNIRYIQRYAYEDTVPTDDVANKSEMQARFKEDANQSTGIGLDLGAMYTFADFWFPTAGFSILNLPTGCQADYLNPANKTRQPVCGTKFTGDIANPDALSVVDPMDIRVGISITPRITRKVGLRIAVDGHHLYVPPAYGLPGVEFQKMLHAGAELFWGNPLLPSPFALRIGASQGFLTTGFGIQLAYVSIDFATYGVDVASDSSPVQDRRMVTSISMVW